MPEDRKSKLIMEWIPLERRKRGRPRQTSMEGVKAAMTRNLEPDQWKKVKTAFCFRSRRQLLWFPEEATAVTKPAR
jgi:hypothetical protein